MGHNSSKTSYDINSSNPNENNLIKKRDLELIANSWQAIENKEKMGIDIMVRIFLEHKEIKDKWIFASNLETEEEMINNSQVKYHGKKIMDLLTKIIEKIITVDPEKISVDDFNLMKLGSNHFHYGVHRTDFVHFEESFFYALKKQVTPKIHYDSKLERSWKKAFYLIVGKMIEGIEKEAEEHPDSN